MKTPVIFHHDPRRTDDELDEIGLAAQQIHPRTIVAAEDGAQTLSPLIRCA